MSTASEILSQALSLPAEQRAEIASKLWQSLPADEDLPVVLDSDYETEIERRLESIRSGKAQGSDLASVMTTLRETLAKGPRHEPDHPG